MGNNQVYKNRALASLEGKWGKAIIATLIMAIVTGGIGDVLGIPFMSSQWTGMGVQGIWAIITMPFAWAWAVYFLRLIRNEDLDYGHLLDGYKQFGRILLAEILITIAVFIGFLLLIVPGIIIALMLSQTDFILKDDREISAIDAMARSIKLMDGHKVELFWLTLSFIGWAILSLLTLGIGFLLLAPYYESAAAHFYEDLKAEEANEVIA
jgi:uncharacterized membrane protein